MLNIPLYENPAIEAVSLNEAQTAIVVYVKATEQYRVLQGADAETFRKHASVALLIEQVKQRYSAAKAQLDAEQEREINTITSESDIYFNGLAL